ncbi:MAG: LCP family protein [Anaerolineales bacterium]|nr:LCP family protein [Anaerolineales bacterium]
MSKKGTDDFSAGLDPFNSAEDTRETHTHQEKTRRLISRPDPNTTPPWNTNGTQPSRAPVQDDPLGRFQALRPVSTPLPLEPPTPVIPRKRRGCGCRLILLLTITSLLYLLFPMHTNMLVLGLDRAPEGTDASRTDTNILISVIPLQPTVNMLSIPRDLWVPIPDVGENRINTAHYFAELSQPGSGPQAALETVRVNFGVTVHYYARIRFDGLQDMVNSMGGVTIDLPTAMSGYDAGKHQLNGEQALAFARNRQGSDDFFRMQRGQLLITSVMIKLANPVNWIYLPAVFRAAFQSTDTNIPIWQMPRLGLALFRAVLSNTLNTQTITRDMVTPFTTNQGANVLLPDWAAINPLIAEMFGR